MWGRVAALRTDIARELRKHDDERLGLIASNVADSAERSIADVIGDIYLAEIERDVAELRDVNNALTRIAAGMYGIGFNCNAADHSMRFPAQSSCSALLCAASRMPSIHPALTPIRAFVGLNQWVRRS